ncbi:MAG: GNAT family N-acetyltransferase [Clostridiales bacterium]|jgi:ribosomal protein S18 acetylase RimI-like enzyme|nr:GNAT family N-acetyltransferase [Clostridiales bacterium]
MIVKCDNILYEQCKGLWREVFGDNDEFISYYFKERTSPRFVLCDVDEERNLQGMLHMIPKRIRINKTSYKAALITGVAVKKEYRGRGIATELLNHAETHAKQANSSFLILQPESVQLFDFYKKLGYSVLGVHKILTKHQNIAHKSKEEQLNATPELLLSIYKNNMRRADGYVERNIKDFNLILTESALSNNVVLATSTAYAMIEVKVGECFCYEYCGELTDCVLEMIKHSTNRENIRFNISPYACEINCKINEVETLPFNMIKPINGTPWDTKLKFNTYERY